ncbi:Rab5-interacting protein (Rab5ip) domain containing protein [Rhypophila decipiens]
MALHCPVAASKLSSSHERRLQRATNLTITTLASPKETQTFARTRTTIQTPLHTQITTTTMPTERDFQLSPIVQESVIHNTRTLNNLQSLTSSLFGVAAGILGLESYSGFLFYLVCSILTTVLFYVVRIAPTGIPAAAAAASQKSAAGGVGGSGAFDTSRYYRSPYEFWTGGLLNGLAGFILTWTLFFGLVRA